MPRPYQPARSIAAAETQRRQESTSSRFDFGLPFNINAVIIALILFGVPLASPLGPLAWFIVMGVCKAWYDHCGVFESPFVYACLVSSRVAALASLIRYCAGIGPALPFEGRSGPQQLFL